MFELAFRYIRRCSVIRIVHYASFWVLAFTQLAMTSHSQVVRPEIRYKSLWQRQPNGNAGWHCLTVPDSRSDIPWLLGGDNQIQLEFAQPLSGCFTKLQPLIHRLMHNLKHHTRAVHLWRTRLETQSWEVMWSTMPPVSPGVLASLWAL